MSTSPQWRQCEKYLEQGPSLNAADFAAWFGANNDGEWVKVKNYYEYTPLHIGMRKQAPAEVIKTLVEACPEAAKVNDRHGNTPLHYGMKHKAPAEVIKLLVEACPEAVKLKNHFKYPYYGNTPLHIGMQHNAPAEVIKLLAEAYPEGAKEKGVGGYTPLHYGMKYNAPAEVIKLLQAVGMLLVFRIWECHWDSRLCSSA